MSTAYNLRVEILSVQAAIATARQSYHSSIQTISPLSWHALSTPAMAEAQRLNPTLAIPFDLYKRYWVCYVRQCKKCIDAMLMALSELVHIVSLHDRLEQGPDGEVGKEIYERLIARTKVMFEEEEGVLTWEMETLKSCFERIRVEKARIEAMAREMLSSSDV